MNVCLTAKELLCAASLLAVSEVIAIPDVFRNTAPSKLREELQEARQALEQKGLLDLDFDGNSTFSSACRLQLDTVFKGEKVVMVDTLLGPRRQASCVYYISGRSVVRSIPRDGVFELFDISPEQAAEELSGSICWVQGEQLSCRPLLISQKQLDQIKAAGPPEGFRQVDANERLRAILTDAFLFRTNYYSFGFLDRRNGGRLSSLIFVDDVRGALKLSPTVENDQNYILIQAADQESLQVELAETVSDMLLLGEER